MVSIIQRTGKYQIYLKKINGSKINEQEHRMDLEQAGIKRKDTSVAQNGCLHCSMRTFAILDGFLFAPRRPGNEGGARAKTGSIVT